MTTIAILSVIPILIICASLYITNRRVDKMVKAITKMYSDLHHHDLIINYALADDLREIKEQLNDCKYELCECKLGLCAKKLESCTNANDPKDQA